MHSKVWHDKNLCDLHLTHIILINKSHIEICHFTVHKHLYSQRDIAYLNSGINKGLFQPEVPQLASKFTAGASIP